MKQKVLFIVPVLVLVVTIALAQKPRTNRVQSLRNQTECCVPNCTERCASVCVNDCANNCVAVCGNNCVSQRRGPANCRGYRNQKMRRCCDYTTACQPRRCDVPPCEVCPNTSQRKYGVYDTEMGNL